jgi:hypothetical protein
MRKNPWDNPEYREKMLALRNSPEYQARRSPYKVNPWDNPAYRAKMAKIRGAQEFRDNASRRTVELWASEEFAQKQEEIRQSKENRAKVSAGLTGRVLSEASKKKMSAAANRRWANREEREKQSKRQKGIVPTNLDANHQAAIGAKRREEAIEPVTVMGVLETYGIGRVPTTPVKQLGAWLHLRFPNSYAWVEDGQYYIHVKGQHRIAVAGVSSYHHDPQVQTLTLWGPDLHDVDVLLEKVNALHQKGDHA